MTRRRTGGFIVDEPGAQPLSGHIPAEILNVGNVIHNRMGDGRYVSWKVLRAAELKYIRGAEWARVQCAETMRNGARCVFWVEYPPRFWVKVLPAGTDYVVSDRWGEWAHLPGRVECIRPTCGGALPVTDKTKTGTVQKWKEDHRAKAHRF